MHALTISMAISDCTLETLPGTETPPREVYSPQCELKSNEIPSSLTSTPKSATKTSTLDWLDKWINLSKLNRKKVTFKDKIEDEPPLSIRDLNTSCLLRRRRWDWYNYQRVKLFDYKIVKVSSHYYKSKQHRNLGDLLPFWVDFFILLDKYFVLFFFYQSTLENSIVFF